MGKPDRLTGFNLVRLNDQYALKNVRLSVLTQVF